ncbi:hypothetical protein WG70_10255 [Burkholderia oklahomensis EO147]|nr:hypothetical protein WG70_10255 [Burkholderia oklahomensis EO147]KUY62125.1 hypothetical protein WG70_05355 [Burkholderia oklahomensis EO147]
MGPTAIRTGAPPTASPHAERRRVPMPQRVGHASACAPHRGNRADAAGRLARGRVAQCCRDR